MARSILLFLFPLILCTTIVAHFDLDSCIKLQPKQPVPTTDDEHAGHAGHHHRRRRVADAGQVHFKPARESPFEVKLDVSEYRRKRPLKVYIKGPELNSFIIQARSDKVKDLPIGTFESIPESATFLDCNGTHDTVISKDTGIKENVEFTWRAPEEEIGLIEFMATVVQNDSYWPHIHSKKLLFNPYPPSLAKCGVDRSCYRQSSVPNCEPDDCDYIVIVDFTKEKEIDMIIGGKIKNDSGYIGIGFTKDKDELSQMDITVCVKNHTLLDVQQFLVENWISGPKHENQEIVFDDTELDGDLVWCKFSRPLHVMAPHMADLTQPLFQTIFTGEINHTNLSPILPPKETVKFFSDPWNFNKSVTVMHLVGHDTAGRETVTNFGMVLITSLMALFLTRF